MPLGEGDVLNTLSDPIVSGMDFWVGPVHVSGSSYAVIRDHIRVGNISVVPGTQNLAFYHPDTDTVETQVGNPPPNLDQRAQLLHECTHAIVDVFTVKVTEHINELAAYIAQHVYMMRSNPSWTVGPNNPPWFAFYTAVFALIQNYHLDTAAGNGAIIDVVTLEPLRLKLVGLPGVNYGTFKKDDLAFADGLSRMNLLLDDTEETSMRSSSVAYESYPDPSDDYLIRTLLERYAASDVAGYGGRFARLRRDFTKCSVGRARELLPRLSLRRAGDRLSELFHDRLSTAGRGILVGILRGRTS